MSVFPFPVHGQALAPRGREPPYLTNPDRRIYRPFLYVAVTRPDRLGIGPYRWVYLQLDPGGDCCLLRQSCADEINLRRPLNAPVHDFRTAAGAFTAWFTPVGLRLGMPTESNHFEWIAPVGFVADAQLPESVSAGIFGIGGGLERFLRTELVLSPIGAEMPVVRIYTPG